VLILTSAVAETPPLQLQARLRLDKTRYEIGEPIPITLELINRGDTEYFVQTSTEDTGALDGCTFVVTDADGRPPAAPPALSKNGGWIGSWQSLGRYDKHERRVFLNHWFLALPPGHYYVHARYAPRGAENGAAIAWPAIRTPSLEFEIVPPTATKLDVRLGRLAEQAEKGDPVAVEFLGFTGDPAAAPALIEAMYADDPRVQRRAANALSYLYDPSAVRATVLASVRQRGPNATAIEWLHARGTPADTLLALCLGNVNADEPLIRAGAVSGLRLLHDAVQLQPKSRQALRTAVLRALDDRDPRVRGEAVLALARDSDAEAIAALARAAREDSTARVRMQAAYCLNDMRTDAVVPLLRDLLLVDYRLRPNYAEQLRLIATPNARAVLRDGLQSANVRVRIESAKQLWLLKDTAGRNALVEMLRAGDEDARAEVTHFLRETALDPRDSPARLDQPTAKLWADWLEKQQ
jgi:HEAT repeat protein